MCLIKKSQQKKTPEEVYGYECYALKMPTDVLGTQCVNALEQPMHCQLFQQVSFLEIYYKYIYVSLIQNHALF